MSAGYDGKIIVWDVSFPFWFILLRSYTDYMFLLNAFLVILDMGRKTNLER